MKKGRPPGKKPDLIVRVNRKRKYPKKIITMPCKNPECDQLEIGQTGYCSLTCRIKHLELTGQIKPVFVINSTHYDPAFAREKFKEYLDYAKANDQREYIPTGKSVYVVNNACLISEEGYANYLETSIKTIELWKKTIPEFAEAMDYLRQRQYEQLINGGLSGKYHSGPVALLLTNRHGFKLKPQEEEDSLIGAFLRKAYMDATAQRELEAKTRKIETKTIEVKPEE
jgi:hypothetical protein